MCLLVKFKLLLKLDQQPTALEKDLNLWFLLKQANSVQRDDFTTQLLSTNYHLTTYSILWTYFCIRLWTVTFLLCLAAYNVLFSIYLKEFCFFWYFSVILVTFSWVSLLFFWELFLLSSLWTFKIRIYSSFYFSKRTFLSFSYDFLSYWILIGGSKLC